MKVRYAVWSIEKKSKRTAQRCRSNVPAALPGVAGRCKTRSAQGKEGLRKGQYNWEVALGCVC